MKRFKAAWGAFKSVWRGFDLQTPIYIHFGCNRTPSTRQIEAIAGILKGERYSSKYPEPGLKRKRRGGGE